MKKCNKCQRVLPLDQFYKTTVKDKYEYFKHTCKDCMNKLKVARERQKRPYKHEQFRRGKHWTKEEVLYLIDNIELDNETLGYKLGRSWLSIQAMKHKIKKGEINPEDYKDKSEFIKCVRCNEVKSKNDFYKDISATNKRRCYCKECEREIAAERYRKKYSNIPPKEKRFNCGKAWTTKELEYIKNNIDKTTIELAYELGRSYNSVLQRRQRVKNSMKLEGEI